MGLVPTWGKTAMMVCAIVAMDFLLAPVHTDGGVTPAPVSAAENTTVIGKTSPIAARDREAIRVAVSTFVWGLSNGEPAAVWHVSPEQKQVEFGTEEAAYAFFVRAHAPLATARQMMFDGIDVESGSPVARAYITDQGGLEWRASFALERDGVGEWRIADCWIDPTPSKLA
jgi:hypothetical protein